MLLVPSFPIPGDIQRIGSEESENLQASKCAIDPLVCTSIALVNGVHCSSSMQKLEAECIDGQRNECTPEYQHVDPVLLQATTIVTAISKRGYDVLASTVCSVAGVVVGRVQRDWAHRA